VNAQTRATYDLMVLMMAMLSAIGIAVLAVLAAGEWPALRYAASAIATVPVGALAFCYRERRMMVLMARLLTLVHLLIDAAFVVVTLRSHIDTVPPAAMIALFLWALWQGLTAAAAVGRASNATAR